MTIHERLLKFAKETAYSYLLDLPELQNYKNDIDILIVGSTATGLCDEHSDVDICILCSPEILDKISKDNNWHEGKPTDLVIDGIQLHYYATSFDQIKQGLNSYNDTSFYVYNHVVLLQNKSCEYDKLKDVLENYKNNTDRISKSVERLFVRRRSLKSVLEDSKDPIIRMKMCIEIIELLLSSAANLDRVAYDKRKRFYQTALKGNIGQNIKADINELNMLISSISNELDIEASNIFETIVDRCNETINRHYRLEKLEV